MGGGARQARDRAQPRGSARIRAHPRGRPAARPPVGRTQEDDTSGQASGGLRRSALLALAVVAFVALSIFGLGMMSLATNTDVIDTPGLTAVPGALGIVFATAAFAVALGVGLRPRHPSFFTALWAAIAAALAYLAGVWIGAVGAGVDLALATSVVGRLLIGWAAPVVAIAAFVAAWGGLAVARTAARPPHWPWEGDDKAE